MDASSFSVYSIPFVYEAALRFTISLDWSSFQRTVYLLELSGINKVDV
jgi:hypothetical protein